jgi:FkbM family methyltransferase
MTATHQHYIPAAGQHWLLPLYDPIVALLTREKYWRGKVLDALALKAGDVLVDVGAGTGSLAIMAKTRAPGAQVIGIDPDPDALAIARKKAAGKGVDVRFEQGFGGDVAKIVGSGRASKVVSTLAFHHMNDEVQAKTFSAIYEALAPGGVLHVVDFMGGHFGHGGSDSREVAEKMTKAGFVRAEGIDEFRTFVGRVGHVRSEKA